MRILCLCRKGNSRSVALAWLLKERMGYEAIAIGMDTASTETRRMLYEWADLIILVANEINPERIPKRYHNKLKVWDVGLDIYFRGFDEDLIRLYDKQLEEGGGD